MSMHKHTKTTDSYLLFPGSCLLRLITLTLLAAPALGCAAETGDPMGPDIGPSPGADGGVIEDIAVPETPRLGLFTEVIPYHEPAPLLGSGAVGNVPTGEKCVAGQELIFEPRISTGNRVPFLFGTVNSTLLTLLDGRPHLPGANAASVERYRAFAQRESFRLLFEFEFRPLSVVLDSATAEKIPGASNCGDSWVHRARLSQFAGFQFLLVFPDSDAIAAFTTDWPVDARFDEDSDTWTVFGDVADQTGLSRFLYSVGAEVHVVYMESAQSLPEVETIAANTRCGINDLLACDELVNALLDEFSSVLERAPETPELARWSAFELSTRSNSTLP